MPLFRPNIVAMHGYVPGEQPRSSEFIKLNTNENPYPCSPKAKAAIGRAVQAGLERYPDPMATALREQAAKLVAREASEVTPEWILCGNGSDDLLTIITRSFVGPGDNIRFPRPSYVLYGTLAEIQGAQSHLVDFAADWSLPAEFTKPCDKLRLALITNPNSPSGTLLSPAEIGRIAAALSCPLVVDEAYADFSETNCLQLVRDFERVIVTRTLSKSYALCGLRCGFLVAQPHVVEQLAKVKDSYNVNSLAITGGAAALEDREWFDKNRAAVLATRGRLTAELRKLGFSCVDSQANFVWCRHAAQASESLYRRLKAEGVLVRYMNYAGWGDGLRISVGTDAQIDALIDKLAAIV